jgi:hypothetical protein
MCQVWLWNNMFLFQGRDVSTGASTDFSLGYNVSMKMNSTNKVLWFSPKT